MAAVREPAAASPESDKHNIFSACAADRARLGRQAQSVKSLDDPGGADDRNDRACQEKQDQIHMLLSHRATSSSAR